MYSRLNLIIHVCPTTVVPLHVTTAKDHGNFVSNLLLQQQTSTSPITLDHTSL